MPAISAICVVFIEFIRGVPLITLLFFGSMMLPLFLPEGLNIDTVLRALVAVIIFQAAYGAEVSRGGYKLFQRANMKLLKLLDFLIGK